MLNTDLHNPSIPSHRRMNLESFIRNCRGINDGEDFSSDFLAKVFNNIKFNEIVIKEKEKILFSDSKQAFIYVIKNILD